MVLSESKTENKSITSERGVPLENHVASSRAFTEDLCPICQRREGCRITPNYVGCFWLDNGLGLPTTDATTGATLTRYRMDEFRYVPPAEDAVKLFRRYFLNRTDRLAFKPPWDSPVCPCEPGINLDGFLKSHVMGSKVMGYKMLWVTKNKSGTTHQAYRWRLGTYTPTPEKTTRWICLDFDGGGKDDHSAPLADPLAVALSVQADCKRMELPTYLERSGGGKGWHEWIFFAEPLPAAKARELGYLLAPVDAMLASGEFADAAGARGIEVFPKAVQIREGGKGNMVWLPFYWNAKPGGNVFYQFRDGKGLVPFIPFDFMTATEAQVDLAIDRLKTEMEGGAR